MRGMRLFFLATLVSLMPLAGLAQNPESLGDAARRLRQNKEQNSTPEALASDPVRVSVGGAKPQAAAKPVSALQLFAWVAGGMPNDYLVRQIRARGLSFYADNDVIERAQNVGADPDLVSELEKASQTASLTDAADSETTKGIVQAAIAMKREEYRNAQRQIRALLRGDSKNPDLYLALGNAYQQLEDWANAGAAYARAVQLAPDFGYAYGQLSFMDYKVGDANGAQAAAEEMIRLQPDSGDAHKFLGLSMEAAGNYGGALGEFHQAKALEPRNAGVYYYDMGLVKADQQEWPTAVEAYEQAIALGPVRWYFYNNLGIALGKVNRIDEAVAAFEKGMELASSRPEVRQSLGAVLCNAGRYERAAKEFRELLNLAPDWNMARPCLYRSLMRTGHPDEAKQVMEDYKKYSQDHNTW